VGEGEGQVLAFLLRHRLFSHVTLCRCYHHDRLLDPCENKLLAAVVQAWAKRANVSRTVQLSISGMEYPAWKIFKAEAEKLDGMQALRLRDITMSTANIDVEYRYTNENLADRLSSLKTVKLEVTEITPNRIKIKLTGVSDSSIPQP
jgi:hypothetical protein